MRRILRAQTLAINSITNSSRSNSSCSSGGDYAVEYGAAHLHCFLPPSSRPRGYRALSKQKEQALFS